MTKLSRAEFDGMMAEIHAHKAPEYDPFAAEEQSSQAFIDSVRCNRWGQGDDKCVKLRSHLGPCVDSNGNTTLTLAADILRGRK